MTWAEMRKHGRSMREQNLLEFENRMARQRQARELGDWVWILVVALAGLVLFASQVL